MSELPPPESLETTMMHGRSIEDWFQYLVTDHTTGEYHGLLECPVSRYGRTAAENAWFAIAAERAWQSIAGYGSADYHAPEALDFFMGRAVNDGLDVGILIAENWEAIPECLRAMLGDYEDVRQLVNEGTNE